MTNAFRVFVSSYLASELGRDTPDSVAAALLKIDPALCRFDQRPSAQRLHRVRLAIQAVHERRERERRGEDPGGLSSTGSITSVLPLGTITAARAGTSA